MVGLVPFFDAFICGLFLRLDITMVSARNEPVNLRSHVEAMGLSNRWPNCFDVNLTSCFIGFVNMSNINSTTRLNHYVNAYLYGHIGPDDSVLYLDASSSSSSCVSSASPAISSISL